MKKVIYFCLILVIGFGLFYFLYYKNQSSSENPLKLAYQEPINTFFNAEDVLPSDKIIIVNSIAFEPKTITIKVGEKVTWVNKTESSVWPASDPHPIHGDYSAFDPQLPMKIGEAWTFTFGKVGKWEYHDHLDPMKRGVIYVTD